MRVAAKRRSVPIEAKRKSRPKHDEEDEEESDSAGETDDSEDEESDEDDDDEDEDKKRLQDGTEEEPTTTRPEVSPTASGTATPATTVSSSPSSSSAGSEFAGTLASSLAQPAPGGPSSTAAPNILNPESDGQLQHLLALRAKDQKLRVKSAQQRKRSRRAGGGGGSAMVKLSHAPVDLTASAFDLLTVHTNYAFKPGDPYSTFLTGQKSLKMAVPLSRERKSGGAGARGGASERRRLTVGKAPPGGFAPKWSMPPSRADIVGGANRAKRELARREAAKQMVVDKWDRLEDLRISIIARMASLKHYHGMLEALKQENKELKDAHVEVAHAMNAKVSQTLKENEQLSLDLVKIRESRHRQRRRIRRQYAAFEKKSKIGVMELEKQASKAQSRLDEVAEEVEELLDFKQKTMQDPTHLTTLIAAEHAKRSARLAEHARQLESMKERLDAERAESEEAVVEKLVEIIEKSKAKLSTYISNSTTRAYKLNLRLHRELALHTAAQESLQRDVENAEREQQRLLEVAVQVQGDPRRKVLALEKWVTCTPEMDALEVGKGARKEGVAGEVCAEA
ncbi:hypothetical protein HK104_008561 [Borealophlyctis nickersoniae]|nr:hypothetical protein HK104_008561 [Borealophlyctis nickersoniae]